MNNPLTFTAEKLNSIIYLAATGSPAIDGLQYRLNESNNWQRYEIGTEIKLTNIGNYVQFQNTKNKLSTSSIDFVQFVMTGKISASGNIQSMLNYSNSCKDYCYYHMFYNCTILTAAPELPATELAIGCYYRMFKGCTSLVEAPELPATTLANDCYNEMFHNCMGLVNAPELPAMTLATGCYNSMFESCSNLTKAPELPATTLAKYCYSDMFNCCISLTKAPELPATTLAKTCYRYMFWGCISLKNKPKLNNLIKKIVYNY